MTKKRVLLVEDGAPARRLASIWLESAGYAVTAVGDAQQALNQAETEIFDAMVVDLGLPDMDREIWLRSLLGSAPTRCVVLAYSGDRRSATREWALAAGCAAYLEKSADHTELLSALEQALISTTRTDN